MSTSTAPSAFDAHSDAAANAETEVGATVVPETHEASQDAEPTVAFGVPVNPAPPAAAKPTLRSRLASMFGRKPAVNVPAVRDEQEKHREASIAQLKRGFNEAVDTMKVMRDHMEDQARRGERMVELLEGLSAMPEVARQQTDTLRSLGENLDAQRASSDQLSTAVASLTDATGRHDHALGRLEQRLGTQDQVRQSLDHLAESMADTARTQQTVREAYRQDLEHTRLIVAKGRRTLIALATLTTLLAAGALGVAVYALVVLS